MQHPTKRQLWGHLLPICKTIQVRWIKHAGNCWRSRDELINVVILYIDVPVLADLEKFKINGSVKEVVYVTNKERSLIGTDGERASDDDDDNLIISRLLWNDTVFLVLMMLSTNEHDDHDYLDGFVSATYGKETLLYIFLCLYIVVMQRCFSKNVRQYSKLQTSEFPWIQLIRMLLVLTHKIDRKIFAFTWKI